MNPIKPTFNEAIEFILSHPDTAVETEWCIHLSTHKFANSALEKIETKIKTGIDLKKDFRATELKSMALMIVDEIKAGRINVKLKYLQTNLPVFAL